ncbi:MAG: FHA domain-containing protein [Kofleriaceae bacterium]
MDVTAHYRNLVALGRKEFLASAAPAALVRYRVRDASGNAPRKLLRDDEETIDEVARSSRRNVRPSGPDDFEIFPLAKKPGASFPDRITIGRTANNDIVIIDHSVSRLHAYVRSDGKTWAFADAGSKNGCWLGQERLEPRKERALTSLAPLRIGEVDLTFYTAADLFTALGGT